MSWRGSGPFLFDGASIEVGFLPVEGVSAGNTGSLNVTLDNATVSSAGVLTIEGALSQTLQNATISATGTLSIEGVLAVTLEDATLSSAGSLGSQGTLSVTLEDAAVSSTGELTISGSVAVTLENATLLSEGIISGGPIDGVLDVTLENATVSATGEIDSDVPVTTGGIGPEDAKRYRKYLEKLTGIKSYKEVTREVIDAAEVILEIPAAANQITKVADNSNQIDFAKLAAELQAVQNYIDLMLAHSFEVQKMIREKDDEMALLLLI